VVTLMLASSGSKKIYQKIKPAKSLIFRLFASQGPQFMASYRLSLLHLAPADAEYLG
jgi:hypothetical protein